MENKHVICGALCQTLKLTRNQYDLDSLTYDEVKEVVIIKWNNGATKTVNVAMDPGTAMIRDIMKAID